MLSSHCPRGMSLGRTEPSRPAARPHPRTRLPAQRWTPSPSLPRLSHPLSNPREPPAAAPSSGTPTNGSTPGARSPSSPPKAPDVVLQALATEDAERPAGQPSNSTPSTSQPSRQPAAAAPQQAKQAASAHRAAATAAASDSALWCGAAPSAEETLKGIVREVRDLGGPDLAVNLGAVLHQDPSASVQSSTLRSAVAALLRLRETRGQAEAAAGERTAALPPWARSSVEAELYRKEVQRVHGDLLKESAHLARDLDLRATQSAAAATSDALATSLDGSAAAPGPLSALLSPLRRYLSALRSRSRDLDGLRSAAGPLWVANARMWRLRDLEAYSDVLVHDATLQAIYLRRLNKEDPQLVIQRMESGKYATSDACEVEYLKALVKTKAIDHFAGDGPPPSSIAHNSLPRLLQEMDTRLTPRVPSATAAGAGAAALSGTLPADGIGATESSPLHVRLEAMPAPKGNPLLGAVRTFASGFIVLLGLVCLWVLGAAQESKLGGMDRAQGQMPTGAGQLGGDKATYAPKEFNKELVPEVSRKRFSDVMGCDEAKEELKEVVEYLKNPDRFKKMGAKLPKGVLLTGPPGTGKTLLAKAVAGEADVPFFYRAGSEFEEMFVGVGSRRVRALFAAAKKKAPCIIFIDEIDSIGSNRKQWENPSRKTLNQMLTEMDGFEENTGVIVIAATNLPEILDPALTRPGRFDRRVSVNVPDVVGRTEILAHYLSSKPCSADVSPRDLARKTGGFSGAQLFNMVNEAALAAAKDDAVALTLAMLEEARDKVMMGKERSITRTVESIERTAYHEAGHALVALFTPGADPLHKATINPRGDALGLTWQVPALDEYSRSRTQMQASIDVCMGGTVAETLVYGADHIGSGATSDLQQATNLARHMVCHCGFSSEIGPMYVDDDASPDMRRLADVEVSKLLRAARTRVQSMLSNRDHELRAVAAALVKDETLDGKQILAICQGAELPTPGTGAADPLPDGQQPLLATA